jgi:hypothetical protein
MFTLTVQDEGVYQRLMAKVEARGGSLDAVLRELLYQDAPEEDSPAIKLLKLIDAAELHFEHPFDGRDAEDILSREMGEINK